MRDLYWNHFNKSNSQHLQPFVPKLQFWRNNNQTHNISESKWRWNIPTQNLAAKTHHRKIIVFINSSDLFNEISVVLMQNNNTFQEEKQSFLLILTQWEKSHKSGNQGKYYKCSLTFFLILRTVQFTL